MAQRSSSVGQLRGCDRASGVRVMYGVCSELRYKVMGPTVRREDLFIYLRLTKAVTNS